MLDRFETPSELFTYKLGSALKMEHIVLDMLGRLEREAQRDELKQQFRHHADETRQQIANLEQSFAALDEAPDEKPCPVMHAISLEGTADIKRAKDDLVDSVILAGAGATEHHEIAVYEWLITEAEAMGNQELQRLLRENLDQERHMLEKVGQATRMNAQVTFAGAA